MKWTKTDNYIEFTDCTCLSVDKIFDCGQCFRFDFDENGDAVGVAMGRELKFSQIGDDSVRVYGCDDVESIVKYLSLDLNYDEMNRDIIDHFDNDRTIKSAVDMGRGIRILRQESFEALTSFIISQNNNIPRIKALVERLCRECGEQIGETAYAFPTPEAICRLGEDRLRELKTGFRAKYIYDAACRVESGETDLEAIRGLDTESALEELMKIKGVGLKVASCAALFGLNKLDTFPVDVWIKRVIEKYYPGGLDISSLGANRGLAQQYLFYYERYKNA